METVDQSPELHLEEIQLRSSDPPDIETPGQGLAAASPETPGGKLTEANAGTSGGKSAEDERILLLTEETKKTPTARRVVYYALCVLTVVAVWSVALLPSVLTYSILRSPVQVIQVQTRVLFGTTKLHCHNYSILVLEEIEAGTCQLGNTVWSTHQVVAFCVGVSKCLFAIQAQDMTSQALYLRYSAYDVIVYV